MRMTRFIQVGVGGFGRVWAKLLKETEGVEVVALVDVRDESLQAACKDFGYPEGLCHKTLAAAMKAVKADALVSCTPPAFHRHDVVAGLKAGLDVISEKPMADSMANCKAMLKAAIASGHRYVVSQNYRYSPAMWSLAKVIRSGELGAVGQVKMDFFMGVNFGGGFRHDMEYPLIVDMSIHHFDLIRYLTGLDAMTVSGTAWNPPWSNYRGDCSNSLVFEMNNGARVIYSGSWCSKGQFNDWNGNWQIECEKGTVTYQSGVITVHKVPELYKKEGEEKVELSAPPAQGQAYVLREFLDTRGTAKRAATDVQDNIRSVSMVFAAVKAVQTGRKIAVLDAETRKLLGLG